MSCTKQNQQLVYVVSRNDRPLMPCSPRKARLLLKAGKARVINREPFTIKLKFGCGQSTQPNTLGIDKGSKFTGLAVINDTTSEPLLQAELRHRTDVSDKMTSRKQNRRARRSRMWYRECRFDNRSSMKREGRLPQSIKTNADEVLRVVKLLKQRLPINKIIVEDVLVDIRKLSNPEVQGKDYQKSNRLDENLRLACLMRDGFRCQHHKFKSHVKQLHAHHIIPRSKGGKDSITNLITLCSKCHDDLHLGKWQLNIAGASNFKDQIAQRTMQGKDYLYKHLREICPDLELVYGYETAERRHELGLPKSHMIDAYCVALAKSKPPLIAGGTNYSEDNSYQVKFRPRQTRRQYFDLPQRDKGRVRYQVNADLIGVDHNGRMTKFCKGDVVKVFTRDGRKFIKQINSIYSNRTLAFARVKSEPAGAISKNCIILERSKTIIFKKVP